MITKVTNDNISDAGFVYSSSWQASHQAIVSTTFLSLHTPKYQTELLKEKISTGWELYLLYDNDMPVGMIGLDFSSGEIGMLYVLPDCFGKGYGRQLLDFAIPKVTPFATPFLVVLNNNQRARKIYEKYGFVFTGKETVLSSEKSISELNYVYSNSKDRTAIPN